MTDLRKAAEMALEALEEIDQIYDGCTSEWFKKRLEALRQALAESANSTTNLVEPKAPSQTEQEPVAYLDEELGAFYWAKDYKKDVGFTPLYTAPPISDYHEGWEEGFKAATAQLCLSLLSLSKPN